jgi:hypothetical protein
MVARLRHGVRHRGSRLGRHRRARRALGVAYLIDCTIYIGSIAFVPAATSSDAP